MRIAVFVAIVLLVLTLMIWVVGTRLLVALALPEGQARWIWGALIVLSLGTVSSLFTRGSEIAAVRWLAWVGYAWLGFLFLLFVAALVELVPQLALWVGSKLDLGSGWEPERRAFISRMLALGFSSAALVAGVWGIRSARPPILVTRTRVESRKPWKSERPFRIVQLTDVHVGKTVRSSFIDRIVAQTNELSADIVVITGDLVDGSVHALGPIVARLSGLKSNFGTYFVTGNHEYYSGAEEWMAFLRAQGIVVLENQGLTVGEGAHRISLAGVNDLHAWGTAAPDSAKACADCEQSLPLVMLAHQPRQFVEALPQKFDLMLSGHTHGGQIFPFNYLVRLQQPFTAGLHERDGAQIYVSRGTGYWGPPMRVGAPSEIALIELSGTA